MKNICSFLTLSILVTNSLQSQTPSKAKAVELPKAQEFPKISAPAFTSFTGKVTKNKVRMRLTPALDSPVIKQLEKDELLIVNGEDDEFYSVEPPEDIKAYIFRTYVLDGVVEGNNINVRTEPVLEAPIIAKLQAGTVVKGKISPLNNKWLEISPPQTTKFYVSKDYIEKVGDAGYLVKQNKRKDLVNQLLDTASKMAEQNLQASFQDVNYNAVTSRLQTIINEFPDFEVQSNKAHEILTDFKEDYLKKKMAYLEETSKQYQNVETLQQENSRLDKAIYYKQQKIKELESQIITKEVPLVNNEDISQWTPQEDTLYEEWLHDNPGESKDDFYVDEARRATTLTGRLERYTKNVKNKPGDYILLNSSNIPVAFLYSTRLNLENLIGKEVSIMGALRSNNNFAYPAFFVLTIE